MRRKNGSAASCVAEHLTPVTVDFGASNIKKRLEYCVAHVDGAGDVPLSIDISSRGDAKNLAPLTRASLAANAPCARRLIASSERRSNNQLVSLASRARANIWLRYGEYYHQARRAS